MGIPLSVLWIVGIINAINLIDGLDGLASGITLVILITLSWLAHEMGKIELMLLMVSSYWICGFFFKL